MLDLWFGLDAAGFDKSSKHHLSTLCSPQLTERNLNSNISSRIWARFDGYIRLSEQYAAPNKFVGSLQLVNFLLTILTVLVSVRYI